MLRQQVDLASVPGQGGPGGANYIHARIALENALLYDGAINLSSADAAHRQAVAANNQADIARTRRNLEAAMTSMVRMEGHTGTDAQLFLNDWVSMPVDGRPDVTAARSEWLRTARARQAGFAVELFTSREGIRESLRNPPQDYAEALARLQLMARQDNPDAAARAQATQALAPLQQVGVANVLARLRSANADEARQAVQDVEQAIGVPGRFVPVNATEILQGTDPSVLRQVVAREDRNLQEGLQAVQVPLSRFVTRGEGGRPATADVRQQAIADVQAAARAGNLDLGVLTDWMQTAHLTLRLHEAATPQDAAQVLQDLKAADTNARATWMVAHFNLRATQLLGAAAQGDERSGIDRLIDALRNGANGAQLMQSLRSDLTTDHIMQRFDDYRVRCASVQLTVPGNYTSERLAALSRDANLTAMAATNAYAREFVQWAAAEAVLIKIREAAGDKDKVLAASRELVPLMRNNRYALAAASQLLLDPQDAESWRLMFRRDDRGGAAERPLTTGVLTEFATRHPRELDGLRLALATAMGELPANTLTAGDYSAMALSASACRANTPLGNALTGRLNAAVTSAESATSAMEGVFEAIRLRRTGSTDATNVLSRLYLNGLDAGFGRPNAFALRRFAVEDGDIPSMRILVGLAAGYGRDGNLQSSHDAVGALLELSRNPEMRARVLATMREIGEPRAERWEARYNPRDFDGAERIAQMHDNMAAVYGNLRTAQEQQANQQLPEQRSHAYEAGEIRRVAQTLRADARATDMPNQIYNWFSRLPQRMDVRNRPGAISVGGGAGVFENVAEAIPGFRISSQMRQALHGLEGLSIDGNRLSIAGRTTINIPGRMIGVPAMTNGLNISLDNVTADLRSPEANVLELTNVRGITLMATDFTETVRLRLNTTDAQNPRLELETRVPPMIHTMMQFADRNASNVIRTEFAISPEQSRQIATVMEELRRPRVEDRNFQRLATSLSGIDANPEIAPVLGAVQSVSRDGNRVTVTRQEATSVSAGDLRINLPRSISAEVTRNGDAFTITDRSEAPGITTRLPLPADVLTRLGVAEDVRLTGVTLGARDRNGHRRLTINTDSILEQVSVTVVERNGQMNIVENGGRAEVATRIRLPEGVIDTTFSFSPQEMARQDILNATWSMNVSGDQAARQKLLERFGIPDFIAQGLRDVSSISHRNGVFDIRREGRNNATISRDGLEITVAPRVTIGMARRQFQFAGENVESFGFSVTGISLARLAPGGIPDIYANQLPAPLRSLTVHHSRLGNMITIPRTGPIRSARFFTDNNMDIRSGNVVVEHPTNSRCSLSVDLRNVNGNLEVDNTTEVVLQAIGGVAEQVGRDVILPALCPGLGILDRLLRD
jgi:hypothetical protein